MAQHMVSEIPVSHTKIIIPALRPEILHRRRLLAHFDDLLDRKLIIVAAPAGYGKTSLLVDFARQSVIPVCWLSLDALDQDPQRFCTYLIAAIQQRFPRFGTQSKAVLNTIVNFEKDTERLLAVLGNEIHARIDQHFALVVDDYQFVDSIPEIRNLFSRFIFLVGENCHIILSSRRLPTLPDITLLVARQQVGGFDLEELAFRPNEIRSLFEKNKGIALNDQALDILVQKTEGWITGLQLSASSLTSGLPDLTRASRATGVTLASYIDQQVLEPQPAALRKFMLQSSLLEEFDVELCEAVLGIGNWKGFLKTLRSDNLFVLPVGPEGKWLRYHHILQGFLQQRCQEEQPELAQSIQLRLAEVYEKQGELEKAYALLRRIEESERLADLIERAGPSMIMNERLVTLRRWLDELPASQYQARPELTSLKGALLCALGDGQHALALLDQAILELRKHGEPAPLALTLVRRAAAHRFLGNYVSAVLDSDEVLQLGENVPELQSLYAEAERFKGISNFHLGRIKEAVRILASSLQHYQHLGEKTSIARVQMELGMAYRAGGDYQAACEVYEASLAEWRDENNPYSEANVRNSLGVLFHAQGDYEKAAKEFEEGLRCIQVVGSDWLEATLLSSLGDLFIDLDEFGAAEHAYARAAITLQGTNFQFMYNYLGLARARLARLRGHFKEARQDLKRAEEPVQRSGSNYERGLFHFERGCLKIYEGNPAAAVSDLELALEYFEQGHLIAETAWARTWLATALAGSGEKSRARAGLQMVLEAGQAESISGSLLQVIRRAIPWLAPLAQEEGISVSLAAWKDSIEDYNAQLPGLRRRLRRLLNTIAIESPALSIRTFGKTQVRVSGKLVTTAQWKTSSVRALFFYLLAASRPLTKEEIGNALWPELDSDQLKLRFKNDLYRLRRALGQDVIQFEGNRYYFNRLMDYDLDIESFSNQLAQAKGTENIEERIALLRSATDLRLGPYLQDIDLTWVWPEREQLERQCVDALKQLAESLWETRDQQAAIQACQAALMIDACREDIHRMAMHFHALRGDRLAVIWQYQACRESLRNDLDVDPSRETEDLYQKLVA